MLVPQVSARWAGAASQLTCNLQAGPSLGLGLKPLNQHLPSSLSATSNRPFSGPVCALTSWRIRTVLLQTARPAQEL